MLGGDNGWCGLAKGLGGTGEVWQMVPAATFARCPPGALLGSGVLHKPRKGTAGELRSQCPNGDAHRSCPIKYLHSKRERQPGTAPGHQPSRTIVKQIAGGKRRDKRKRPSSKQPIAAQIPSCRGPLLPTDWLLPHCYRKLAKFWAERNSRCGISTGFILFYFISILPALKKKFFLLIICRSDASLQGELSDPPRAPRVSHRCKGAPLVRLCDDD